MPAGPREARSRGRAGGARHIPAALNCYMAHARAPGMAATGGGGGGGGGPDAGPARAWLGGAGGPAGRARTEGKRGAAAMAGKADDEARAILERREDYQEMIQDCIREMRRESDLEMRREMRKKRIRERIDYDMRVRIPQTLARAYGLQMIAESC